MAIDIKSPQFPESIFEGTLSSWLKKEGQEIKQDEVLAEIETDKVVIEVTAPSDGVMGKVLVDEGAIIKSSEVIGSYKESAIENDSKVVEETDVPEEQVKLNHDWASYVRNFLAYTVSNSNVEGASCGDREQQLDILIVNSSICDSCLKNIFPCLRYFLYALSGQKDIK